MAGDVCPIWAGYFLLNPLRRFLQNPERIFGPYVRSGMTVLDIGCAMGFFSLPLAKMVGPSGKVICVDIQERMLEILEKRAQKAGVSDTIETHICPPATLGLEKLAGKINLALAFALVHEVPDPAVLFAEVQALLRDNGIFFMAEPRGHVQKSAFAKTLSIAEARGFRITAHPRIARSYAAILEKRGQI